MKLYVLCVVFLFYFCLFFLEYFFLSMLNELCSLAALPLSLPPFPRSLALI